ncbi:MAG: uracil-DNA glycosylase [Candidatus Pelagibacterales bacterium]|jgi:uracil-DNA glycosylase family 4|tara:strand:- start:698 stop:1453 length:756 start_codon:yes stop_codon:yes gene_type:complete
MGKNKIKSNLKTLRVLRESGISDNLSNSPINRFEIISPKLNKKPKINASNKVQLVKLSTEKQLSKIQNIEELKLYINNFKGCDLYKSATNAVFSDGNEKAKIMLIGEAPGHDEDLEGKPFVGRSGKLLDKMLNAIDLDREKVYIANIIPWRPPANRRPTKEEIEICLPIILKHIELINPKVLLLLGSTSTYALLKNDTPITKIRGEWFSLDVNGKKIQTMPTFHPAFLLRQPKQKKHVWTDLQNVRDSISK